MKRELLRAFLRMDVLSSQHNFLTVRTTRALGLMLDHDHPLRRQLDHLAAFPLHGCDLTPARYDLAVAALGGHGEFVERADDLPGAIERALASGRPACINVMIESIAAPTIRLSP